MFVIVSCALFWVVGLADYARHASRAAGPPPTVDAILVFTGPEDARLTRAFDLYDAGLARRLLVSGAGPGNDEPILRRIAGRPPRNTCCVAIDNAADTLANARLSATWARQVGAARLMLVTADHHMPRAAWLLQRELQPGTSLQEQPVPVQNGWGWLVLVEYQKYLVQRALALFGQI